LLLLLCCWCFWARKDTLGNWGWLAGSLAELHGIAHGVFYETGRSW
jgi:hypothetical protein